MWSAIAGHISQVTGQPFEVGSRRSVSGGCINQGYRLLGSDGRSYFVKINQASRSEMFVAEALGLKQMGATQTIRVPHPICWGMTEQSSYIVLEWLEFGRPTATAWARMGRQLAAMHRAEAGDRFGWERNNTIGSTPQLNDWSQNWADFFAKRRIGYQLQLARLRGGNFMEEDRIIEGVGMLLSDRNPTPSLVHGDLWSGNVGMLEAEEPVILDPAVYYGDREADIAMTELFGGFPAAFYQGYQQTFPLDEGYARRKNIYNLYHILNHFNLFGGGYARQAQHLIQQILER